MVALRRLIIVLIIVVYAFPLLAASQIESIIQRAPLMNPNLSSFPECSLIDNSSRLSAPAGKFGFVVVKDGHFAFEKGPRVRFFGINLAKDTVFIDKPQIDRLTALFARAGINIVRIHHIDDTQGILDPDPGHYFRPERLDLVDYWIAKLKERGIYVALDLNDYRTFLATENVQNADQLGRGAKPYAVFDERLIELQQEYARKLLMEHVNPYTKLSFANDPAVALLEIYDENGLFIRRADLPNLAQPYKGMLQQQWNAWLRARYDTTARLRSAWTDVKGQSGLMPLENLELASVLLPRLELMTNLPSSYADLLSAPTRVNDGAIFAYEMQKNFLRSMREYLHEIGIRIPITAVGAQDILPDLMATAATCDYIGMNFYWDHPQFDAGKEWKSPGYFSLKSPLTYNSNFTFPVTASLARMPGKPLVVRELGYCYPNPYRGLGMIEAAAYGAFLDLDALILFTYDAHTNARSLGYFDIHLDPLRWGLVSQAGRLFQSGEVAPAKYSVGIGYSETDAFTWYQYLNDLYSLAYVSRVCNYTDTTNPHPFSVLLSSGRSSASRWVGNHIILFANQSHTDLHYQTYGTGLEEANGYNVATDHGGVADFTFHGICYNEGIIKQMQPWSTFLTADLLAKGLMPVATSDATALGFVDPGRQVMCFHNLKNEHAIRVTLDALRDWYAAPVSHADLDQDVWKSDTGQLQRMVTPGIFCVETPKFQCIAGKLDTSLPRTSALLVQTTTPLGTVTAESLDERPLAESTNYLVKMTSRAHNDQQKIIPVVNGPKSNQLVNIGTPPILTDGKNATTPTHIEVGGKVLLDIYLQNGTWEYLVEPNRALLYVDTGDVEVHLPKRPNLIRWYSNGDAIEMEPDGTSFTVPNGVKYTEIVW